MRVQTAFVLFLGLFLTDSAGRSAPSYIASNWR